MKETYLAPQPQLESLIFTGQLQQLMKGKFNEHQYKYQQQTC